MKSYISDDKFKSYYITLTSELLGYCIEVKVPDFELARSYAYQIYPRRSCRITATLPENCKVLNTQPVILYDEMDIM